MLIFEAYHKSDKQAYYVLALDTARNIGHICAVNWYPFDTEYFSPHIECFYALVRWEYAHPWNKEEYRIHPELCEYDLNGADRHVDRHIAPLPPGFSITATVAGKWKKIETHYALTDKDLADNMEKVFIPANYSGNVYLLPETLKRKSRINYKRIPEYFRSEFEKRISSIIKN